MENKLTLGSLFDGSGGFPLGGIMNGITPIWASEIAPFPIRVTTKRIPSMKHYGDICSINGAEIEPVDIITFGSPCTDMSLAGKRAGLDGKQSVLFHEALRIIKEMRLNTHGQYPRFIVWENVPGAFSSNKGQDFQAVLREIVKIKDEALDVPLPAKWLPAGEVVGDGFSMAWRAIDAQYFGVAQRRRRIYLIADLTGRCAGDVLFESESLSGNTEEDIREGKEASSYAEECPGSTISFEPGAIKRLADGHYWDDKACCLRASMGDNQLAVAIENHPTDGRIKIDESGTVQTLTSRMGTGGNNVPLTLKIRCGCDGGGKGALLQDDKSATLSCNNDQTVFIPKIYGICSDGSNAMKSDNPESGIYEADTSRTIDGNGGNPSCNQGGMAVVYAMTTGAFADINLDKAATLMARDCKDPQVVTDREYCVRRLTPAECALLQGFPPDWCCSLETAEPTEAEIGWWSEVFETYRKAMGTASKPKNRKQITRWLQNPYSDAAEYKMWGNGVALPCVSFVLSCIVELASKDE